MSYPGKETRSKAGLEVFGFEVCGTELASGKEPLALMPEKRQKNP
jgi:hypothetical protein